MNDEITNEFTERLVTLANGRPGLRGTLHVDVQESLLAPKSDEGGLTPDTRHLSATLDFIASDETLDRYGEIITARGWRLENYRRNPVFQNAHQYGDIIFTLGRALLTEVRDGRLYQRIEFATEVNPMARIAYGLYKGKFLNAVSVGFVPLRWVNGSASEPNTTSACAGPQGFGVRLPSGALGTAADGGEIEKRQRVGALQDAAAPMGTSAQFRRKYIEQELLEVSAVGIPANPNALALGLKSGAVEKSDLRELSELIRETLGEAGSREEWKPVPIRVRDEGEVSSEQEIEIIELLKLAREVRDILKKA